jgi:cyclopropane-fatty-acyl-phospholipid synthase
MGLLASAITAVERAPLPDVVTRAGVGFLVGRARRKLARAAPDEEQRFARAMSRQPIATHVDDANAQHYEVPAEFFSMVLGPRKKYSCCLYDADGSTLKEAEDRALEETVAHADLADGQRILELGCGWGSLSLYMAVRFPNSIITSVSNSKGQRASIEADAARRGLTNLTVITADMNDFQTDKMFDRIVSVEMFEHISNWRGLLERARSWLWPEGRIFIHVFTHRRQPYRFDEADKTDWIAQHFFTGGIMPSEGLIGRFPDLFSVEKEWRWNGKHYERTALDWLANFDAHSIVIEDIFRRVYGDDANIWKRRWRLFFLATAGLFGHADGEEWGVSHYRLAPVGNG